MNGSFAGFSESQTSQDVVFSAEIFFAVVSTSLMVLGPDMHGGHMKSDLEKVEGLYAFGQMTRFKHRVHSTQGAGSLLLSDAGSAACDRQ